MCDVHLVEDGRTPTQESGVCAYCGTPVLPGDGLLVWGHTDDGKPGTYWYLYHAEKDLDVDCLFLAEMDTDQQDANDGCWQYAVAGTLHRFTKDANDG